MKPPASTQNTENAQINNSSSSSSEDLGTYLLTKSLETITLRNARQFETLLHAPYISSGFTFQLDGIQSESADLATHVEQYRRLVAEFPAHYLKVVGASVSVQRETGNASVYVSVEMEGGRGGDGEWDDGGGEAGGSGIVQTAVAVFAWKMVVDAQGQGRWMCVRSVGMRGGGDAGGM